jgi:phenylalanyl-tRNA synthetase alpha chain
MASQEETDRLAEGARAAIAGAASVDELEAARVAVLGRSAPLTLALRGVGGLPPEDRGPAGKRLNVVRVELERLLGERSEALAAVELEARLAADRVDVTLPAPVIPRGGLHILTQTRREIEDIFLGLGYRIAEGPEIDTEWNNFTALNFGEDHPAKAETDTLWINPGVLLRTHTSPVQVRTMASQPPPVYVVCPGRVFRRDTPDATHSAIFHQVEGLAVDRGLTLADLKGTLRHLARSLFGERLEVRLRSGFFPFTEPSVEVDVECPFCTSGCSVCKGTRWIEILGSGMVDPNVFGFVGGYDPEEVSGFAFGLGIERIAMLRHEVEDIRTFYDNDLRVLEQYPS